MVLTLQEWKATATEMVLERNNGMLMIRYSGNGAQFEFSKAVRLQK
jgi:hypothetical protein